MGFWDKVKDAVSDAVTTDSYKDSKDGSAPSTDSKIDPPTPADAAPAPKSDGGLGGSVSDVIEKAGDEAGATTDGAQAAPAPKKSATKKPAAKKEHKTYTVKSGDTLSEIGERFGVNYMDIARLNNIENPDLIYPGQVFKIPNK